MNRPAFTEVPSRPVGARPPKSFLCFLAQAVAALVRDLVADAERMGIELPEPGLCVEGSDGEDPEHPQPPGWWRNLAFRVAVGCSLKGGPRALSPGSG